MIFQLLSYHFQDLRVEFFRILVRRVERMIHMNPIQMILSDRVWKLDLQRSVILQKHVVKRVREI
jgi:hypothetical protein